MVKTLGFGKAEKLKSRKAIDALFAGGQSQVAFPVRVKYSFVPRAEGVEPMLAGVSVSRRQFKHAVDRNRIKRLLREAYRLQKGGLTTAVAETNVQAHLFFIYTGKSESSFDVVFAAVKKCLRYVQQNVPQHESAD